MNLSESNVKKLQHIIEEHQFGHATEYLMEHVRQGIRLSKQKLADYSQVCTSRIGGDPDLPSELEWPEDSEGRPMTFLAQLKLEDIAPHDLFQLMPVRGMLYFFIGLDEPAYNIEHRVFFLHDHEIMETRRRISPEITSLEEKFTGYHIEARSSIELPNYAYVDYDQVEDEHHDFDAYEDLCFDLNGSTKNDLAVMFGYPATQHGDCEYEAALMLVTGKEYSYSPDEALDHIKTHLGNNSEQAEQEVQNTLLLLAIDSDDDVGFCWWDAGELQFFIRKEDLLAGNFSKTYCSLYSS